MWHELEKLHIGRDQVSLGAPMAPEIPVYLYISSSEPCVLHSTSIATLLKGLRAYEPVRVSSKGLSFLLQSLVCPPPFTIYKNVYILGAGDSVKIERSGPNMEVAFTTRFPYPNAGRQSRGVNAVSEHEILEVLYSAYVARRDPSRETFLFHSAGKDSNAIALAIAEAGAQKDVTLLCHRSSGGNDESEISARIAKRLGFSHRTLNDAEWARKDVHGSLKDFLRKTALPSLDHVVTTYPAYLEQCPELYGSNIVDGMGSDMYMGHIVPLKEHVADRIGTALSIVRSLSRAVRSESRLRVLLRSCAEASLPPGLSFRDALALRSDLWDVQPYWSELSGRRASMAASEFRAWVKGRTTSAEMQTRKVRMLAEAAGATLVLPWANAQVVALFSQMPLRELVDHRRQRNKVVIRDLLKARLDLDSDAIGKKAYRVDYEAYAKLQPHAVRRAIEECPAWDGEGVRAVVDRLATVGQGASREAVAARSLLYRLHLLSLWLSSVKTDLQLQGAAGGQWNVEAMPNTLGGLTNVRVTI